MFPFLQRTTWAIVLSLFMSNSIAFGLLRQITDDENLTRFAPELNFKSNIFTLAQDFPTQLLLPNRPWADFSWKLEAGILAYRYADREFLQKRSISDRHQYITSKSARYILAVQDKARREKLIDNLSPAEKYDLLVGDDENTLTNAQWGETLRYSDSGSLAGWMGICEGSAAASVLYPEPQKAVTVYSPQGDKIQFHILDLKGLSSLLWSSYNVATPILGLRCQKGWLFGNSNGVGGNPSCFDNNPGTWHIFALNYLNNQKAPFFIDRRPNKKVYNVPVVGYKLTYINTLTGKETTEVRQALVPAQPQDSDRLGSYHTLNLAFILGVKMKVSLAVGNSTTRDKPESASVIEETYRYDLELDKDGQILGGEWQTSTHPDFIWVVAPQFKPFSTGDKILGTMESWDGGTVPASWLSAVRRSSRQNQPLEKIVSKLIELAK